jgi:hypothetical protein
MRFLIAFVLATSSLASGQDEFADERRRIKTEERAALIALYEATDGPNWTHRDGWLGAPGTECSWYGVLCSMADESGRLGVVFLHLRHNGLRGRLPNELSNLSSLEVLQLDGNQVAGPLAQRLLEKWDDAQIDVQPASLVHDVREIRMEKRNPSVLCFPASEPLPADYRTILTADGRVRLQRPICRTATPEPRDWYCEERSGKTYEFDLLARYLVKRGLFAEEKAKRPEPVSISTHSAIVKVKAVRRDGSEGTWEDPVTIEDWAFVTALEGVRARVEWKEGPKEGSCWAGDK